jgi:large subunit ribosomal protein L21
VQASRRGDHRRAGARQESATKESSRVYAIVRCGGRQEKVALDDVVTVDKLDGKAGSSITLTALLVVDGDRVISDPAEVGRYQVTADIVGDTAGPKINMIHYRNKTGYRRRLGHRQRYTQVRITGIGTEAEAPTAKASTAKASSAKASSAKASTAKAQSAKAQSAKAQSAKASTAKAPSKAQATAEED